MNPEMLFYEVSAMDGSNVNEAFMKIAMQASQVDAAKAKDAMPVSQPSQVAVVKLEPGANKVKLEQGQDGEAIAARPGEVVAEQPRRPVGHGAARHRRLGGNHICKPCFSVVGSRVFSAVPRQAETGRWVVGMV